MALALLPYLLTEVYGQTPNALSEHTPFRTFWPLTHRDRLQLAGPLDELPYPIAGWLLTASALTGIVWDDNVFQTSQAQHRDWGVRFMPAIELVRESGIHRTSLHAVIDSRLYRTHEQARVIEADIGAQHVWEVQRDFVLKAALNYDRRTDLISAGNVKRSHDERARPSPQSHDRLGASLTAMKSFGSLFMGLSGSVSRLDFENPGAIADRSADDGRRDHTHLSLSGRVGHRLGAAAYAFLEGALNSRQYDQRRFTSQGSRLVAGLGIGEGQIVSGEIFAGHQQQDHGTLNDEKSGGLVFGGRLSWHPRPDLTFQAEVDKRFGEPPFEAASAFRFWAAESTALHLRAQYEMTALWAMSARLSYATIEHRTALGDEDLWIAGSTLRYGVWRNLTAIIDWQYVRVQSQLAAQSFERNILTFGLMYRL